MVQILTVCRIDTEWCFRDVTGAEYARSTDITDVVEAAQRMARRVGSQVQLTAEAEEHYRSAGTVDANAARADDRLKPLRSWLRSSLSAFLLARRRAR